MLSGFLVHSSIVKSEASALIDFMSRSAKKVMVEPSATVCLGLNSAALHDVSCKFLFHCVGVRRIHTVVGQACERVRLQSNCKVTDYGSHVQRILTGIDGIVKKHVVTLDEEKGEITFVERGHVAAIALPRIPRTRTTTIRNLP